MKPDSSGTAAYLPQVIEEYRGNPFIEALPPIFSPAEAVDAMTVAPSWNSGNWTPITGFIAFSGSFGIFSRWTRILTLSNGYPAQFVKAISTEIL